MSDEEIKTQVVVSMKEKAYEKYLAIKLLLKDIFKTILTLAGIILFGWLLYQAFKHYFIIAFILAMFISLPLAFYLVKIPISYIFSFDIKRNFVRVYRVPNTFIIDYESGMKIQLGDQKGNAIYIARDVKIERLKQTIKLKSYIDKEISPIEFYSNAKAFEDLSEKYQELLKQAIKYTKLYEIRSMERARSEIIDVLQKIRKVRKGEKQI